MPPQNMPLSYKNDFELKAIKKKQTQEKLSTLPSLSGRAEWMTNHQRQCYMLTSPEMAPKESTEQTLLKQPYLPLVSPYSYFPIIWHPRSSKSLSSVLSLFYNFIVLLWRCYIIPNSNQPLKLFITEYVRVMYVCVVHTLINLFVLLLIISLLCIYNAHFIA